MSTLKNSSTSILIVYDSILQLLLATRNYTLSHMPNADDRDVYTMAMTHCGELIRSCKDEDYNILIDRLMESKLACRAIKNPWFGQHMPRQQGEMAHDHAIDIVRTLSRRFITGVSSESKTVHRAIDVNGRPIVY